MLMSVAEELEQVQFLLMSGRRIVTSIVSVDVWYEDRNKYSFC